MSNPTSAAYQVVIPQLGLTMREATIMEWLQPDGAWVEKGQPLFVIENEKSVVEIEAPASGRLVIQTPSGATAPVLHPIARLEAAEAAQQTDLHPTGTLSGPVDARPPQVRVPAEGPGAAQTGSSPKTPASPRARAAARKLGIELAGLTGSGPRGMVTVHDLPAPAEKRGASPLARQVAAAAGIDLNGVRGSGPRGRVMRRDVEQVSAPPTPPALPETAERSSELSSELRSLSGLRRIIAERLSQSWRERPQVTLTTEADASLLVMARSQMNAELARSAQPGERPLKISYNALLVKLLARALADFPYINARLTPQGILPLAEVNIGVAVDTDRGLLAPVVRHAGSKSLPAIQGELQALVERAQQGRSLPDDLTGGTFTLTNLGAYDIDVFTPLINPPECAILGVGRILARPVGLNGQIVLRETVALSLSFDHRLVDGAPAARFLQRVKQLVEQPFAWSL